MTAGGFNLAKAEAFSGRLLTALNHGALCLMLSVAQGGEGLGAMWGEEKAIEYLTRAGFQAVETRRLAHDIQNNWYVARKRASGVRSTTAATPGSAVPGPVEHA